MKQINYSELPEADVVIDYIETRKKKGLYSLILTTGLPGTGKSSMDLRLAECVSERLAGKNLITHKNIIDSTEDLIKFLINAKEDEVWIGVIEEISVLFPSRRAMSHDNVVVGKLLDTARKKQVVLFANAPLWPTIDSHIRALGNIYIETLRINRKEGVCVAKALRLQTNPGSGKTYFHWLKRKGKEVNRIFVKKPSKETWYAYELRKDKFMDDLYRDLMEKTLKKKEKGAKIKPLTEFQKKVKECLDRGVKIQKEIAKELGVLPSKVSDNIKFMRNKGLFIEKGVNRYTEYLKKPMK